MQYTHGGDIWSYEAEYHRKPIDFSSNISPYGMPESVRAALKSAVDEAEIYPDPLSRELRTAIGGRYDFPAENIVCGNGAADLIWRIALAFRPKKAVIPVPTFTEYRTALEAVGCEIMRYCLDESHDFDLDWEILPIIDDETDIVFICDPNNPTGRAVDTILLEAILDKCRRVSAMLVLDGSFADFLDTPPSILTRIDDNLIILRSMTKIYAMAGVRLGWCVCGSSNIAEKIYNAGQPWAVSVFAQRAGIAALGEDKYTEYVRKNTDKERAWLEEQLRALGVRVISGSADFLFLKIENMILKIISSYGIIVRVCWDFEGLSESWVRIAVRCHRDNELLIAAVREALPNGEKNNDTRYNVGRR